jgi:hypothetical protein
MPDKLKQRRYIVTAVLSLLAVAVFLFQPHNVLFGPGNLGWVSSHTLAIIRNATPERWFLGFACEFTGISNYAYFDRYPVLFSGLMHVLLAPFQEDFETYISWARIYMNGIYILCMLVGYRIALLVTGDRYVALLATIFTFMGVFFMFYKDMIHYDQPAVLGLMVLFYGIARYELRNDSKLLWLSVAIVLLGRGYASNFLLLLWNLIFVTGLLIRGRFNLFPYLRSTPFKVFFVAGLLSAGALAFNVISEAEITGERWKQTSIVRSAMFRLKPDDDYKITKKTALIPFTIEQGKRTVGGLVPYAVYPYQGRDGPEPNWLLIGIYLAALLGLFVASIATTNLVAEIGERPGLWLLGLLAGFFWLYPLRTLAAFHNYTHMYNAVFYLLAFSSIFYFFKERKGALTMVCLAVALFMVSLVNFHESRIRYNLAENDINGDIGQIRYYMLANDLSRVFFPEGRRNLVDGSPYASCLYFSGFKIADELSEASVVVGRDIEMKGENPLPDLEVLEVYRVD